MRGRSTCLLRDPWFSISLRSLQPPCSASPHSPRRHSTDRPSDRSGTQSPSALNTRRSDSRDMAQDKYAGNQQIRANVPSPSPRGWHDAIRGEKRARRAAGMEPADLPCSRNARPPKALVGRAVEDQSDPILGEITSRLGGSIYLVGRTQSETSLFATHDITDSPLLVRLTGF